MLVSDLIKQFEKRMRPYAHLDSDLHCMTMVDGVDLMDALEEAFEDTDVRVRYWWDYDD